jgi:hypothetical protein
VLLDPGPLGDVAAAGALAAQPPAELVHGDLKPLLELRGSGQLEGGGDRAGAAPEDSDLGAI